MRTRIKTLAIITAVASSALIAGAQQQNRPERTGPKPEGFNCPVCGSPCVSKASVQRKLRQRRVQNEGGPRAHRNTRTERPAPQWQADREGVSQQPRKQARQQKHQQMNKRFDIDGDGQLTQAERTALRAYREALNNQQGEPSIEKSAPKPPID